jgi:ankyrin repeat protein
LPPDTLDAVGATPFLLAASVDDLEMMHILLDAGADPKIPQRRMRRPSWRRRV